MKYRIMWDDAIPSKRIFFSKEEAEKYIEKYTNEYPALRIGDNGDDEWYDAITYFNPEDKQNYSEYSIEYQ